MTVSKEADFAAPDGFGDDDFLRIRANVFEFSSDLSGLLADCGFTDRQAGSVAANLLLDAAWAAAFVGALTEDVAPDPAKFIEAAQAAVDRLGAPATLDKFWEFVAQMRREGH